VEKKANPFVKFCLLMARRKRRGKEPPNLTKGRERGTKYDRKEESKDEESSLSLQRASRIATSLPSVDTVGEERDER